MRRWHMSYQHDFFISYRRRGDVQQWVNNHFYPRLKAVLDTLLPMETIIWIDTCQEIGVYWPHNLKSALLHSKFLIAIWTPDYFSSPWCMAELSTMLERARILGLGSLANPHGLVYPIVYSDGNHFPPLAQQMSRADFTDLNFPYEHWKNTTGYVDFHRRITRVAQELEPWLARAPMWREDWPVCEPPIRPALTQPLPKV